MRKVVLAIAASAALLVGYTLTAFATTGAGTLDLPRAAKDYSPVATVACNMRGPLCPIGYTRVCRFWKCWCARCGG
jgi:hypothetical protein